jgi:hypothetical protein
MERDSIQKGFAVLTLMATMALASGCHQTIDKEDFRSALNRYYSDRQVCLFDPEVKLPVQADASNEEQTRRFDALTDAGLLQRTPEEKKRFLIGSKQVNDYDLTAQGRTHWAADASQPGFGNFCVGAPTVKSIDNFVPAGTSENQYSVTYTYGLKLPDWANNAEIQSSFPRMAQESSGESATATLTKQGNEWQVGNVSSSRGAPLPQ